VTHSVSTFFTGYSALLDGTHVEAIAVVVSDGENDNEAPAD
jgi:hypothetical protein